MKLMFSILLLCTLTGCTSSIKWQTDPNEPVYTLTGKAANTMADVLAKNTLDRQGRTSELQKYNPWLYTGLVLALVAGIAFWGYTRSHYGWVIPAAAVSGIGFITLWAEYGNWIMLGVAIVTLGILVWKAVEYQRERNKK